MNFSKRNKSIVDFLFIIALFGSFAITGLFVVLFGARVYESTVSKMDANYASRTALSYVTEKVRSHDCTNGARTANVSVDTNNNQSVLILSDIVADKEYLTYLFVDNGYLMEYTTSADNEFNYDVGAKILKINDFKVTREDDALFKFNIVDEYGNATQFYVTLYSGNDGGGSYE